jgi:hypothetical protein
VALATIAAFAALLSGLLGGTEGWVTQTALDKVLVAAIFVSLGVGVLVASDAAYQVRRMVFKLKDIKSEEEFFNLARIGGFGRTSWLSQTLLGLAWTLIIIFVLSNIS